MEAIKLEMVKKYPEAERYFDLENTVKQADNEIMKTVRNQVDQLKLEFSSELLTPGLS